MRIECAHMVSGFPKLVSIHALHSIIGWDPLSVKRRNHCLFLYYKILSCLCPDYLSSLIPHIMSNTRYQLRNNYKNNNTQIYIHVYIHAYIHIYKGILLSLKLRIMIFVNWYCFFRSPMTCFSSKSIQPLYLYVILYIHCVCVHTRFVNMIINMFKLRKQSFSPEANGIFDRTKTACTRYHNTPFCFIVIWGLLTMSFSWPTCRPGPTWLNSGYATGNGIILL